MVRGTVFSTFYQVSLVSEEFSENAESSLQSMILRETEFVEGMMSRYRQDSELSRLNRHEADRPMKLSPDLAALLSKALEVSRITGGAFDVTVGPLLRLWGFHKKEGRGGMPTDAQVASALERTGYQKLNLNLAQALATKRIPDLDLDLSAIAKGYGVDRIADALEKEGFHRYLVEIGGEIRAKGSTERGIPWRVGIEKPISERRETFQVIALQNRAVATSGDYRNFYFLDGRRISHTIDPRTGWPVSHGLASVTVVHRSCTLADALATGLTVLGPKEGFDLAARKGVPALFITRDENNALVDRATAEFRAFAASRKNTSDRMEQGESL